ncbi:MAG: potassium transporter Kup [Sorangiineae bacterium]|nr:potassium transporter Kup [Polyangiaceae bacterium]MEB2323076.1 potassium transporter Kup [Sorangiineae bacterium]
MSKSTSGSGGPRGRYLLSLSVTGLGVVYGDLGTSPLYSMRECFRGEHSVPVTGDNVLGVLSLIFWSLTLLITVKYLAYVMRADNRGEGGILALAALASSRARGRLTLAVVVFLGLFGAALLYGDGMITPAISVLSAVEGLGFAAPALAHFVVPVTIVILIVLFLVQHRGTASVGLVFGPVMLTWFTTLAALGIAHIVAHPSVLVAFWPGYAVTFLVTNGLHGLLVLGGVFLVVTGGEALYADMGHFGARPIRLAWGVIVLPALVLNYFGQGALLLTRPDAAENPFYAMAPAWALYPLVVLSTVAAIIASQAVISGAFSLTRQAIMLGFWPRVQVEHTSAREIGQIYVPVINWVLMLATIGLVLGFGSSANLAAAYGIAVTTTMVITTLLAFLVARQSWGWSLLAAGGVTAAFLIIDMAFFGANIIKVERGGWFPLVVAAGIFLLMTTWKKGRAILGKRVRGNMIPLADFYELIRVERPARVPGTAVFMTGNADGTPPALIQNFTHNRVLHKQSILLTIVTEEVARVSPAERFQVEQLEEGFVRLVGRYGFMEEPDVPALLSESGITGYSLQHTTFFMGRETLLAEGREGMARWREVVFAAMSRNAQRATAFFNIPPDRVMEIGAQIEL